MANRTGNGIRGKICISKQGKKRFVYPDELDSYLKDGYHLGNDNDTQKAQGKKWYNNGVENILIKKGDEIPSGFHPGMLRREAGSFSSFNYRWYTNGVDQKKIREGDAIPDGWYRGQSPSQKEKNRQSQKRKGNYHLISKPCTEEYKELYHDINKLTEFVDKNHSMTLEEMATRFNCSVGSIYSLLNTHDLQKKFDWYGVNNTLYSGTSHKEKEVVEYIKSIYTGNVIENYRKLIPPYEVDIYIPDRNLAIEFNGTYWHGQSNLQDKKYHFNKSKLCEGVGVRLIHIYEWEWPSDKIKQLLKIALNVADNKIFARKCEIRLITNEEARPFNDANHLQGHRNAQVTYGLFYQGELVQLMSFSKTKYNKNLKGEDEWEIIRGCPGSNNVVVGGVDKLFKHFLKEQNPKSVFSYCDYNKFDGTSYEKIGMHFVGYSQPDKTWIVNGQPVKRNPSKYKELKESAEDIIWGSGSKKFIWKRDWSQNEDKIFN